MSFQAPLLLLGLLALPLLWLALLSARRRRRRYAVRFPGATTVAAVLPTGLARLRRLLPAALLMAALAALVVALARPERTVAVPDERATVVLVTDTSRSMLAEDVSPSRLAAAQAAARTFLERVPEELRVGAVAYAESPRTLQAPTTDRSQLLRQIDQLVADGSTATGDALAAALALVGEPRDESPDGTGAGGDADGGPADEPPAALVLLSDGASVTGRDPVDVAGEAEEQGVPIYTISLGTSAASVPAPDGVGLIPVPPDPETMRAIAEASGGRAFDATDAETLDAIYDELGSQLGTRDERREVTAAFAAGALVLLLGGVGLSLRWSGRLP